MICSKCSIDKPETDYATYFHSTQNIMRTRKVCRFCFNEQKKLYRESIINKKIIQPVEDLTPTIEFIPPPIDYSTNPEYKCCSVCKEWKHLDDYYFHQKSKGIKFADCIECHKSKDKGEWEEYLEKNGGHDRILTKTNQYMDQIQKDQTFMVMETLGYTFHEEQGIWLKENVKTLEEDGKIKFHFLKYTKRPYRGKGKKISELLKDRIIMYRKKGYSMGKISLITGVSDSSICKIIKEYENK